MELRMWTYVNNNGDGSVSVRYFPSSKLAEEEAADCNERLGDDIEEVYLQVQFVPGSDTCLVLQT